MRKEIERIHSPRQQQFLATILIEPYTTSLAWEYGAGEVYVAWVFGDLGEREVVAQYCRGGFGTLGLTWSINFRLARHFGQDSGWYRSLKDLIEDWGISE